MLPFLPIGGDDYLKVTYDESLLDRLRDNASMIPGNAPMILGDPPGTTVRPEEAQVRPHTEVTELDDLRDIPVL
jgi:hypothetical protein